MLLMSSCLQQFIINKACFKMLYNGPFPNAKITSGAEVIIYKRSVEAAAAADLVYDVMYSGLEISISIR